MQLLARLVGKVVYGACFGRETDAYLVYLALVGGVWLGIAFFLYLLQCYFSSRVEFELEDIYIIGTLEYAVNAPLARLLLNICVLSAKQAHDEIEGVLEVTFALHSVLLALEAIGDVGEEGSKLKFELFEVATKKSTGHVNNP